jgi:signal transduction histidine kinase
MTPLARVLTGLVLAGLVAFAVAHAVWRFGQVSDRAAEAALDEIRGEVVRQAARIEGDLELVKHHARYLATLPSVAAVADSASEERLTRAGDDAKAVLVHFPAFGSIVVLGATGDERLRVERMGGGVAVMPRGLLRRNPAPELVKRGGGLSPGEVWVSPLELDEGRVDVAPDDRKVLRYLTRIESKAPGTLVVSLYASPLFERLRTLEPVAGARMMLCDRGGRDLLRPDPLVEALTSPQEDAGPDPIAPPPLDSGPGGAPSVAKAGGAWYASAPTGPRDAAGRCEWILRARVPDAALRREIPFLRGDAVEIGLVLLLTLAAIGAVAAVVVKLASEGARLRVERAAERKLAESERLAALGRLTAGVAHEINNPLSGIANYLALLERESGDAERRREYVGLVKHGLERIRVIVSDLLSFANPPQSRREAVDLDQVIERVERVTRHDAGFREIAWSRSVKPGTRPVLGDPFALEQVFLNLALNARDAIQRGAADPARPRGAIAVKVYPGAAGDVEVWFEDSGPGLTAEVLPRIFQPFFTTRAAGTGLGLSVTASIVAAHGGTIRAENRPEGGARFILRLPAAGAPAVSVPIANAP